MRFTGNITLRDFANEVKIPTDYRIHVASLLKEAINLNRDGKSIYNKYFGDKKANKTKPFTFSFSIPNILHKENGKQNYLISNSNNLKLHFSTNDYPLSMIMYTGLILINKVKDENIDNEKPYRLFGHKVIVESISLKSDLIINKNEMTFKILSPVVIRKIKNKKGIGYLTFEEKEFHDMLFYSIRNLTQNFISKDYELNKSDIKVDCKDCKEVSIYHYNSIFKATSGIIHIKAPAEVLQLIYDVGLGARRSQGFGMLEKLGRS